MRIVLDANVLVSALLNIHGAPAQVLDLVRQGLLTLCTDGRIHGEYGEVLNRPDFPFDPEDVAELIKFLRESSEVVAARPLTRRLPDPEDRRAGVPVMTPGEMIAFVRQKGSDTDTE